MALIRVLSRCNQKCVFCSWPAESAEEAEPGLRELMAEISGSKDDLVQFSGGEPLLLEKEWVLKLCAFCLASKKKIEFQTNAALLRGFGADFTSSLASLVRRSGGYFNVNFPAHNKTLDMRITGTRNAFADRVFGVRSLVAAGATVRLTCVISSFNYSRLPDLVKWVERNLTGISRMQFSYTKGMGRAAMSRLAPRYGAASPYLKKAIALCVKYGLPCDVDHIPPCYLGRFSEVHVDVAKLRGGFPGAHLEEKAKISECRGCSMGKICAGPRRDYIEVYGRL